MSNNNKQKNWKNFIIIMHVF
eukprot:UN06159